MVWMGQVCCFQAGIVVVLYDDRVEKGEVKSSEMRWTAEPIAGRTRGRLELDVAAQTCALQRALFCADRSNDKV